MRQRLEKREEEDTVPNVRIEPTFGPANEPSTKPGTIRTISVEEYKKQIAAARKSDEIAKNAAAQNDETDQYNQANDYAGKFRWRKLFSATMGIALVSINVALMYFELQPKILKPTFSIATPWGVAEVLTPWGTEPEKVAQLRIRKAPPVEKEDNAENTGYYDK